MQKRLYQDKAIPDSEEPESLWDATIAQAQNPNRPFLLPIVPLCQWIEGHSIKDNGEEANFQAQNQQFLVKESEGGHLKLVPKQPPDVAQPGCENLGNQAQPNTAINKNVSERKLPVTHEPPYRIGDDIDERRGQ